jgi:pyruvate kinase
MLRRTKIVATLGPACSDPKVLDKMIEGGVDVVRLNFSHGSAEEHQQRCELVRSLAKTRGRAVGVLVDLQGPKIRIGKFKDGKIYLKPGDKFILDAALRTGRPGSRRPRLQGPGQRCDPRRHPAAGRRPHRDVGRGGPGHEVHCKVVQGGVLSNNKGINRKGGGLSASALTEKDKEDIKTAAAIKADYLAVSFPRSAADIQQARDPAPAAGSTGLDRGQDRAGRSHRRGAGRNPQRLRRHHGGPGRPGRGGGRRRRAGPAEAHDPLAREKNKVVITATQMMESMINAPCRPVPRCGRGQRRAGRHRCGDAVRRDRRRQYPVEAISAMHRVCLEAEKEYDSMAGNRVMDQGFLRVDEAIAMSAAFTALHLNIKAIAAMTQSGSTALWMSRISTHVPIYALTPEVETRRKVTLFRGVYPVNFKPSSNERDQLLSEAEDELRRRGAVRNGDLILLTIGEPIGKPGGTNTMKIVRVGERKKA